MGMFGVIRTGRMNIHIIKSMARDVPMRETSISILPFLIAVLFHIALLVFVPGVALYVLEVLK